MANRSETIRNRGKDFFSTKTLYNGIYLAGMAGSIMMGIGIVKSNEEASKAGELWRSIPDKIVAIDEPKTNVEGVDTFRVKLIKNPQSTEDVSTLLRASELDMEADKWYLLGLAGLATLTPGAIVAIKDCFNEAKEETNQ